LSSQSSFLTIDIKTLSRFSILEETNPYQPSRTPVEAGKTNYQLTTTVKSAILNAVCHHLQRQDGPTDFNPNLRRSNLFRRDTIRVSTVTGNRNSRLPQTVLAVTN
jgi:hypothetical protein